MGSKSKPLNKQFNRRTKPWEEMARILKSDPGGFGLQIRVLNKEFNQKMKTLGEVARTLKSATGGLGLQTQDFE